MADARRALLALACGVSVLASGCTESYGEFPADKTYTSVDADAAYTPVPGTSIRLEFADDRISAEAGCNRLFGTVDTSLGTLSVDSLGTTNMGCPADLMEQDRWLYEFLSSKPRWSREDGSMTLDNGRDRIVFTES